MLDKRSQLIYLAGTLYSKTQALHRLLQEIAETDEHQGELRISHRDSDGRLVNLLVHVDGTDFSMTPDDSDMNFRLDLSGNSVYIE